MPSTYAHYRMGQEVLGKVSDSVAEVIQQYPDLYNIGLHGPDLLFYYNALNKNHVNTAGVALHKLPGRFFFERTAELIRSRQLDPAYLAHAYGYICHFALDVSCHRFVEEQIKTTGVGHLALETELDRRLLTMDGKNPLAARVTGHLIPGRETAEVIKDFYPGLTTEEILKSIKDMGFYLNLLVSPGRIKYGFKVNCLKLVGKFDSVGGLLMDRKEKTACKESVDRLLELYEQGKKLAVRLIEEYMAYIKKEAELDSLYDYNFNSILVSDKE